MRKDISILVLGLLVAAVAFLDGIPREWETVIVVVSGLLIALLSYLIRRDSLIFGNEDGHRDTFVQSDRPHFRGDNGTEERVDTVAKYGKKESAETKEK